MPSRLRHYQMPGLIAHGAGTSRRCHYFSTMPLHTVYADYRSTDRSYDAARAEARLRDDDLG